MHHALSLRVCDIVHGVKTATYKMIQLLSLLAMNKLK